METRNIGQTKESDVICIDNTEYHYDSKIDLKALDKEITLKYYTVEETIDGNKTKTVAVVYNNIPIYKIEVSYNNQSDILHQIRLSYFSKDIVPNVYHEALAYSLKKTTDGWYYWIPANTTFEKLKYSEPINRFEERVITESNKSTNDEEKLFTQGLDSGIRFLYSGMWHDKTSTLYQANIIKKTIYESFKGLLPSIYQSLKESQSNLKKSKNLSKFNFNYCGNSIKRIRCYYTYRGIASEDQYWEGFILTNNVDGILKISGYEKDYMDSLEKSGNPHYRYIHSNWGINHLHGTLNFTIYPENIAPIIYALTYKEDDGCFYGSWRFNPSERHKNPNDEGGEAIIRIDDTNLREDDEKVSQLMYLVTARSKKEYSEEIKLQDRVEQFYPEIFETIIEQSDGKEARYQRALRALSGYSKKF